MNASVRYRTLRYFLGSGCLNSRINFSKRHGLI